MTVLGWPDDRLPRYVVVEASSFCVFDRAYAWRLVREFLPHRGGRTNCCRRAIALCAELNRADIDGDAEAA